MRALKAAWFAFRHAVRGCHMSRMEPANGALRCLDCGRRWEWCE